MPIIDPSKIEFASLPTLPREAVEIVKRFESGAILGASRTVRLICEVFRFQVDKSKITEGPKLAFEIQQTGEYFTRTRGKLSPAIGNAIRTILTGITELGTDVAPNDVRQFIYSRTAEYEQKSLNDIGKIAHYGANMLHNGQTVMAYDYSSSVNAVLRQAAEDGKILFVVIPESRALDGGIKILREIVDWGHKALFTVDAAMGHELQACSAVFVGVESLTVDGGFWTTVGTRTLAILAQYYKVPFYVPTELIKIDPSSASGNHRIVEREPIHVFDNIIELKSSNQISFQMDDLEFTPRTLVTSYITETGILPPEAICTAVEKYIHQFR